MDKVDRQRNQDATLFCAGLSDRVSEALLRELFVQCGPVEFLHFPRDRVTGEHQDFAFVEFKSVRDAMYAMKVMSGVPLFGRPISLRRVKDGGKVGGRDVDDVGAKLFVGNLSAEVTESVLADVFGRFGRLMEAPEIVRPGPRDGGGATGGFGDTMTSSCGFGFVKFDTFEASDAALEALQNQLIGGRPLRVDYAMRGGGSMEKHGSEVERKLAARAAAKRQALLKKHADSLVGSGSTATASGAGGIALKQVYSFQENQRFAKSTEALPELQLRIARQKEQRFMMQQQQSGRREQQGRMQQMQWQEHQQQHQQQVGAYSGPAGNQYAPPRHGQGGFQHQGGGRGGGRRGGRGGRGGSGWEAGPSRGVRGFYQPQAGAWHGSGPQQWQGPPPPAHGPPQGMGMGPPRMGPPGMGPPGMGPPGPPPGCAPPGGFQRGGRAAPGPVYR